MEMRVPPLISVVTYIDHIDGIERHIQTIADNTLFKSGNVEILLLDSECSAESISLCEEMVLTYGERIRVFQLYKMSIAECYNVGIFRAKGIYINFSLSSSFFQEDTLEHIYNAAVELKCPSLIAAAPWTVNEIEIFSQYFISPRIYDGKKKMISLEENSSELMLCLQGFFIKRSAIFKKDRNLLFSDLGIDTSLNYIIRLLCEEKKYLYVSYSFYHYTVPLEDNTSAFLGQYENSWYLESMEKSVMSILDRYALNGIVPMYLQRMILWCVYSRFNCNYNDRSKGIINESNMMEFYSATKRILQYIDDRTIWNKGADQTYTIPRTLRLLLLRIKDGDNLLAEKLYKYKDGVWKTPKSFLDGLSGKESGKTVIEDGDAGNELEVERNYIIDAISGGKDDLCILRGDNAKFAEIVPDVHEKPFKICDLKKEHVLIDIINYEKGKFTIDGRCSIGDFELDADVRVFLKCNNTESPTSEIEVYRASKIFGKTYQKSMRFQAEFFFFNETESKEVTFWVSINGIEHRLMIRTGSIFSHISMQNGQYWRFTDDAYMQLKDNTLVIQNARESDFTELENEFINELSQVKTDYSEKALNIRRQYFKKKTEKKKPIWVTFDKLYKAGDNGEYMFHYIRNHVPDIDMYYLVKEDASDYSRLMESDPEHILTWGRNDTVVMMLLADVILATHANVVSNAGIDKPMIPFLADLFCPFITCIQHGLTVQNIAQYQNRIFDNTQFYVLASPNEYKNINTPIYGYNSDSLELTGMARYDGLKSRAKKQILITPTWRRNVANSNIAHFKKAHNEYFRHSEYFRLYNTLINDSRLIACAEKKGYKIVYLIHPAASSQIDDFDRNDFVDIIPAAGDMNYEKILTESALMVTDYSGVQFDFAYMKKPVLYYHPSTLPPHYEESDAYRYERDSFGPIISEHEKLVDALCEYMVNDCVMLDEYKVRVDRFFAYNDNNNCERIYNAVFNHINNRKVV